MPIDTNEAYLHDTRLQAEQRLTTYINGLVFQATSSYPDGEVESWPIQKAEAEAFLALGNKATLNDAPMITRICLYQYGESDRASALAQVTAKAEAIAEKAAARSELLAFVVGLRARIKTEIEAQTTIDGVAKVTHDAITAIEEFRTKQ